MNKFPAFGRSIVEEVALPNKPQPPKIGTPPAKLAGETVGRKATPDAPPLKPHPSTVSIIIKKPERPVIHATEDNEIVVFFGTLSLSRALVFNALIRSFAESKNNVLVVSAKQWSDTLKWMWADRSNVKVFGVGSAESAQKIHKTLSELGKTVLSVNHSGLSWDKLDYEASGVPFEERWSKFIVGGQGRAMVPPPIPEPQSSRYALVHDDAERGWNIRKELLPRGPIKIIRMDKSHPNLFAWSALIQGAYEIHCVPSAVSVLVDSIPTKANQLVLHNYTRPGRVSATYKKQWGVIA